MNDPHASGAGGSEAPLTTPANDADVAAAIAAERGELAAVLAGLPEPLWDAPTLCAGWRLCNVAAHLTMPFRYSIPQIAVELLKSRGNFHRMADRTARRDASAMTPAQLVAVLTASVGNPWTPPGGGLKGALSHDVIHGLDITVPLGIRRQVPEERLRIILPDLGTPERLEYFGVDLWGVQLRADDFDWTLGTGTPVHGAGQDLLLAICGRLLPPGHLTGVGSERFTAG
jgi:uncharacterized protein (TIGR03083 family)